MITDAGQNPRPFESIIVYDITRFGRVDIFHPSIDDTACNAADLDRDGVVNVSDLFILLSNWNKSGLGAAIADPLDIVNVSDLFGLLSAWSGE